MAVLAVLLSLVALAGCAAVEEPEPAPEEQPAPPACDERLLVEGACPGVGSEPVCPDPVCTDGVACAPVLEVSAPAELAAVAAAAVAGSCVALPPGDYEAVVLPAGVSLLGAGALQVRIAGVETSRGGEATIRGLTVGAGGISVDAPAGAPPGHLTVDRVEIRAAAVAGLLVEDTSLSLSRSTIADEGGYGIAAYCAAGCACAAQPVVELRSTLIHSSYAVGAWLHAVQVVVAGMEISGTLPLRFETGRGMEVGECARLTASGLLIQDNADVGLLVDGSGAILGPGLVVARNLRGIQLQNVPAGEPAELSGFEVVGNLGVGIGADGETRGMVIQEGLVADTGLAEVPATLGGTALLGDGIEWLNGSELLVAESVTIQGSGRHPVLISAASEGSFHGSLLGDDGTKGMVIQEGAPPPDIAPGVLQQTLAEPVAVALPVAISVAPR